MVLRPDVEPDTVEVLRHLRRDAETLAVAESLTGGLLAATLTSVPGASAVFRGSVVAYATDLKIALLDVPASTVEQVGVVSSEVAVAMAEGVRARCGSTWGVSTTGVAGPDEQEGKAVGTVFVGWAGPGGSGSDRLQLRGAREEIRVETCGRALSLLRRRLKSAEGPGQEQSAPWQG